MRASRAFRFFVSETYIRLNKGFVYLMAIIDWFSRYVVDWELSIPMDAEFCIETLARVLSSRRCDIFNSDQEAKFTSKGFTGLLKEHNIKICMDGLGRALDNIFVEHLWRTVKYECVYIKDCGTQSEKLMRGFVSILSFIIIKDRIAVLQEKHHFLYILIENWVSNYILISQVIGSVS